MNVYYYLDAKNTVSGPCSLEELRILLHDGVLSEATYIATEGASEWRSLGDVIAVGAKAKEPAPPPENPQSQPGWEPARTPAIVGVESDAGTAGETRKTLPSGQQTVEEQLPAAEVFPWDSSPELVAKAKACETERRFTAYAIKCNEFLNGLNKRETFEALKNAEAEMRVYPDFVGVDLRGEESGCLPTLVMKLPEILRPMAQILVIVFRFVWFIFWSIIQATNIIVGLICLGVAAVMAVFAVVLSFALWYIAIPVLAVFILAVYILSRVPRTGLAEIAARIRRERNTPWAVGKLFRLAPTVPRYWHREAEIGKVTQIIRVETRRHLLQRSLICVVQDNPKPQKEGCVRLVGEDVLSRMFVKRCRIFVLAIEDGSDAADRAARQMSAILGVPVSDGEFRRDRLVIL